MKEILADARSTTTRRASTARSSRSSPRRGDRARSNSFG